MKQMSLKRLGEIAIKNAAKILEETNDFDYTMKCISINFPSLNSLEITCEARRKMYSFGF